MADFFSYLNSLLPQNTAAYQGQAIDAATIAGVPTNLYVQLINTESGFNPEAYNPSSGATGIAQFLPSTAANPGYGILPFDPSDPYASLNAGADYLKALFNKTGSYTAAVAAYQNEPYSNGQVQSVNLTSSQQSLYSMAQAIDQGTITGNTLKSPASSKTVQDIAKILTQITSGFKNKLIIGVLILIGILVLGFGLKALTGKDNVIVKLVGNKEILHGASGKL